MKTSVSIATYCAVIIFSYPMAQAQDDYRDKAAVDVSVRAGVEEQVQQPSQGGAKQTSALSSWSFQPAKAAPAIDKGLSSFSSFQPLRQVPTSTVLPTRPMTTTAADPSAKRQFSKLSEMPNYLGIFPPQYGYGSATRPPALTAPVSPLSSLPGSQGFSKVFDRNLLGPTSYYPFSKTTYPAARGGARVWQHKPRAKKPSNVLSTTAPLDPLVSKRR